VNRPRAAPFVLIAALTLTLAAPVDAQTQWVVKVFGGVAASPSHGFVDLEQTAGEARPIVGGAAGIEWRALQFEAEFATAPTFFKKTGDLLETGRLTTIMGSVTWMLPRPGPTARLRPYLSGGMGVVQVKIDDALAAFSSQSTLGAATAGGGVLIRVRPRFGVNVEARYLRSQFQDQHAAGFGEEFVAYTRISGGAVFRF
jgi:Outer membrane protein beta-barrel domain